MKILLSSILLIVMLALTGCGGAGAPSTPVSVTPFKLALTSPAFAEGGSMPPLYSCVDKNISPALTWGEPPAGTQSFALIMDDPDAPHGTYLHWVVFNIPVTTRGLPEGLPNDSSFSDGSLQGFNDLGTQGYIGPCPPAGVHRYSFRLYALDVKLGSEFGALKAERQSTLDTHTLAKAELIGTFKK